MSTTEIVVDGVVPTRADDTNLRDECWSFALDQRAFGPGRVLVAFADRSGRFRGLAHTLPNNAPLLAVAVCLDYLGRGADAAVVFSDELVEDGPPSPDLLERFTAARALCHHVGIHLVDWILCDDLLFRSLRLSGDFQEPWWDVP